MKTKACGWLLGIAAVLVVATMVLPGCSKADEIVFENGSKDYEDSSWTHEALCEHLTSLGFTNIVMKEGSNPTDKNYLNDVHEVVIASGALSGNKEWEAGDAFPKDAEITIYYSPKPLLTPENSSDFLGYLESDSSRNTSFGKKYDGYYVSFDGCVVDKQVWNGGTSFYIDVAHGDYSGDSKTLAQVRVGKAFLADGYDRNVEEGENVHVEGRIVSRDTDYYKHLYLDTLVLRRR